jgi:hypothetical protein
MQPIRFCETKDHHVRHETATHESSSSDIVRRIDDFCKLSRFRIKRLRQFKLISKFHGGRSTGGIHCGFIGGDAGNNCDRTCSDRWMERSGCSAG